MMQEKNYIQIGLNKGLIRIDEESNKITYFCGKEHTERFSDPEEKVRAKLFVELIIDYQYAKERILLEDEVPRRSKGDWADIVVYNDNELKHPFLVVECKRDGITQAEYLQAIEQTFGNANSLRANYAAVVAGNTRTAFDVSGFKAKEREKNVIADFPVRYGKAPQYRYVKGDPKNDLRVISKEDLIATLKKAHDTIWQGGKIAPTAAFDEVAKLLFCKLQDEKERTITKKGDPYKFQIGTHESPFMVYSRIDEIYQIAKSKDAEVFKEDIKLDERVVYLVIEHLQGINFVKTDLDTKGVAFEVFMEDFFKGKMGQFFTPREIVKFCLAVINPNESELVLDPACGSGGFLLNCLDHIREIADEEYPDQGEEHYKLWHDFAKDNLYGIEVSEQIARICKMNMIIHDDGHTNVISYDALKGLDEISAHHKKFHKNAFDVIITNPPFGASIKLSECPHLDDFRLGKSKKSQKSEVLFIERCIEFLKKGSGRLCMVIPDNILINKSLQPVRNYILSELKIDAIVSLPDFAFSHYGANVKSSLIFAHTYAANTKIGKYPIFMANVTAIGYTASGKKDQNNDLPVVLEAYKKFLDSGKLKNSENIYTATSSEVAGKRLDPNGYSPAFKALKERLDASDVKKFALSEILLAEESGEWGKDEYADDVEDDEILCYVLRNTNFDNYFNLNLDDVALRYISNKKIAKLQLRENDILIEKSGGSPVQPVGRVALVNNLPSDKPVIFSNFLQMIRVDESKFSPKFVYTYLRTLWDIGYMKYIQNQTTGIKNLLMDEFLALEIPFIGNIKKQDSVADSYISTIEIARTEIRKQYEYISRNRSETLKQMLKE